MLEIENFGRKSLEELKKVLEDMGLSLGMDVSGIPISKATGVEEYDKGDEEKEE
jgi:DNA-directed RNA polymerase subunit alpha